MALSRVCGDDNLYIGGIRTLNHTNALDQAGITHIISVLKYDFKNIKNWDDYEHLRIEVDDLTDVNLLEQFSKSNAYIEEALKNGKDGKPGSVLVHCAMGISRSVTIVLAFLLRRNPGLTVNDALSLVRRSRPMAHPNIGFMAQLELFREMGCPRDVEAHPKYQRWLYQKDLDAALISGNRPDVIRFRDEEEAGAIETGTQREIELKCKNCRRILATTPYIVKHSSNSTSSIQQVATPKTTSDSTPPSLSSPCTSHFIEALSWMRPTLEKGELKGRLTCPNSKCSAQVGRYSWLGQRCSCNIWVCPSFSLQKSRCDDVFISSPRTNNSAYGQNTLGIRYPPKA